MRRLKPAARRCTCQPSSRLLSGLTSWTLFTLTCWRTPVKRTPSRLLLVSGSINNYRMINSILSLSNQATNALLSHGARAELWLGFPACAVVVLIAQAKVPLATCAVVVACTPQLSPTVGGTVASTSRSAGTPWFRLSLPLASPLSLWLAVFYIYNFMAHFTQFII